MELNLDTLAAFVSTLRSFGIVKCVGVVALISTFCLALLIWIGPAFFDQMRYEMDKIKNRSAEKVETIKAKKEIRTGNISVVGNAGPTQISVGSPGGAQEAKDD